jgi:dTDP-4-dehydrorhamnose 3,5-epimerase-like enzyme
MPEFADMRGTLSVAEVGHLLPFAPQRYFLVYQVPSKDVRGEHAHRTLEQFLVCVQGSVSVVVDDGTAREEFLLNRPTLGIYIPPLVWATQYRYSSDAILMVLASAPYDADDYIRNYDEFLATVQTSLS